ncbi:right-handed parallel beta-helix repeat-containing protein [Nocardia sp. NPDC050712]|uniref:right-handed parallel beta-helix repeat-containing protein n=1 Tax=Nocardia sp. NPDC050712 TaxID=3155518 RepID=UPI0033DA3868
MNSSALHAFRRNSAVAALCCAVTAAILPGFAAAEPGRTWYVGADAAADGNGSQTSPFNSLAAVQAAAGPGDTIVVLAGSSPLDGGLALAPRQKLLGRGGTLTNTTTAHDGDAVRLAPDTEVRDLTIAGAQRAGIYGRNVGSVLLSGNTVSGTNRACRTGFVVQPFPPMLGVPFGMSLPAAPNLVALTNGWAGIMVDSDTGPSTVTIERNTVRDTACGDGIDVRTSGAAQVSATLTGNLTEDINEGLSKFSVLAVGLQSTGASALTATLRDNVQRRIALPANDPKNAVADSEGLFINAAERARMRITIAGNRYEQGGGHFSANGIEFVTSNGTPDSEVTLTDSEFRDVPGDIVQNLNLSNEGARHVMTIDGLVASGSSFPGAALNPIVPGNLGTCVFSASFGRANHTALTLRNARLSRCSADGLGVYAYSPAGPDPARHLMTFAVSDTTISGAQVADLHVRAVGDLTLTGALAGTQVAGAVALGHSGGTLGPGSVLDFTGGGNCLTPAAAEVLARSPLPVRTGTGISCG